MTRFTGIDDEGVAHEWVIDPDRVIQHVGHTVEIVTYGKQVVRCPDWPVENAPTGCGSDNILYSAEEGAFDCLDCGLDFTLEAAQRWDPQNLAIECASCGVVLGDIDILGED